MNLNLDSGRYVVAVSGGVDSIALLHMLTTMPDVHLTVAHFDHGIRVDSKEDRKLVQQIARAYGLPFVYHEGKLGVGVSEAVARKARYDFLHRVRLAAGADAIVTAHHEDDLIETVIMNLVRGTNRRGLSSLKSTDIVKRPLLKVTKKELLGYANRQGLRWREDSTNSDDKYLRNYVRHNVLPRFAEADREALLAISGRVGQLNSELNGQIRDYLKMQPSAGELDRHSFIMLPHTVAREIMAEWLLQNTGVELSKRMLERLVQAAKTGRANTRADIDAGHWLEISRKNLALRARER